MKFMETKLKGAYIIELEPISDERGFFARSWCQKEFSDHGLNPNLAQCSISHNIKAGTLRGMHYQAKPYEEAKLVRCTKGAIYDVILDLRPNSETFKEWIAVELTDDQYTMIYIAEGIAHGFLTLKDNTEVFYQISGRYEPQSARGLRWDDPSFSIKWPFNPRIISDRDRNYQIFQEVELQ